MQLINQTQREILNIFTKIPDSGQFYLTGGTALSYFYLKHRQSNDIDFFTINEEIIFSFSRDLEEALRNKKMDVQRQLGIHSFVELFVKSAQDTTIIHLACDAAFRIEPIISFPEYPGLKVDSLTDIAANKLLALFGRAMLRDFIDIYFLVKEAKFTTELLMEKAKQKDPGFDLYWLGVALERIKTFSDDSIEMLLLTKRTDCKEMFEFFRQWREKIAKELL